MARIRTLKPEHKLHRKVGPLSHVEYRLWIGMITEADDEGRLVADPGQLRAEIFGHHLDITTDHITSGLKTLCESGLVRLYEVAGVRYVEFPSWHDHQRINRPIPSILPSYESSLNAHGALNEDSLNTPGALNEDSRRNGKERNGKERNGKEVKGGYGREIKPRPSLNPPKPRAMVVADSQWIETLKTNPAYQAIDVDREFGKLLAWLQTPRGRGKQATRTRFLRWLNHVEVPMDVPCSTGGVSSSNQNGSAPPARPIPGHGWPGETAEQASAKILARMVREQHPVGLKSLAEARKKAEAGDEPSHRLLGYLRELGVD